LTLLLNWARTFVSKHGSIQAVKEFSTAWARVGLSASTLKWMLS